MAKPRKQKNGDQPKQNPGEGFIWGEILHQKICLSIDVKKRQMFGYTEIKVNCPESGIIGLHAENMAIVDVSVNGEPAEFELNNIFQEVENEQWRAVQSINEAAEAASEMYVSQLDRETRPNLLIPCRCTKTSVDEQKCHTNGQSTSQNSPEGSKQTQNAENNGDPVLLKEQNTKLVRINYIADISQADSYFRDDVFFIDNQTRGSHCWFPSINSSMQRCCFNLEFTVDSDFVAVSSGRLLYQILSDSNPPRRTYVYSLGIPVCAGWITFVVAPFEVFPDSHKSLLSHLCLPKNLPMLRNTVGFFHTAFSYFEDYLSAPFPFGSYTQVFVPPELLASSVSIGASLCIISSDVLFDEKIVEQIIDSRIKLAHALSRQWFGGYIVPESPNDEWLIDGLAGFLMDSYITRFLGNNEARFRRYKANCSVCQVDITGATALSSVAAADNQYGTQKIGLYGKIRSWKAVAILQMLEKQMGPEPFRKILQIIAKGQGKMGSFRSLSTREFRHLANKIGNLERPFLKEFFPRWVDSCGCPVLRLGLSYVKRKNIMEIAAMRGSSAFGDPAVSAIADNEKQGIASWPGMMSIRVHELDGVSDHPSLPLSGDTLQLLEIQLHSRLASKRSQKPKKGAKLDGSDDNGDAVSVLDAHACLDSPLLWIRIDPEMEYLSEVHFHQPVQMWINQLEKDRDVVAQSEAIAVLKSIPQISFPVVSALNNLLNDSKAFWRVRIEAAFALAHLSSKENDWAGLLHLIKFFKNRRFDMDIGLPKPNNFQDVPEYFVLEAIPLAIASVRGSEEKSPREAVEFILQLLKYNDNNGSIYSDVYWLASLVQSIGELELGKQGLPFLPSLLKCIDRLLQFDRLMPRYNGILTTSCIRTLCQFALKMLPCVHIELISKLIRSFRNFEQRPLKVRLEANRSLLNLELYGKGFDAALLLLVDFLTEEMSIQGQVKLAMHMIRLCHANINSECREKIKGDTLASLLRFFASRICFNNFILRHHLFCIIQIVAGRPPTLYAVPRVLLQSMASSVAPVDHRLQASLLKNQTAAPSIPLPDATTAKDVSPPEVSLKENTLPATGPAKEADAISNSTERRIIKIRVKQRSVSGRKDEIDNAVEFSRVWHGDAEVGPTSSVSVDAPPKATINETLSVENQMAEEVYSCRGPESRITASVGSAKMLTNEDIGKELQCTADSKNSSLLEDRSSPIIVDADIQKGIRLPLLIPRMKGSTEDKSPVYTEMQESLGKQKKEKRHKEKKRKRDEKTEGRDRHNDPEYLEKKRLKKEKRRMEKEMAHSQMDATKSTQIAESSKSVEILNTVMTPELRLHPTSILKKSEVPAGPSMSKVQESADIVPTKVRIKFKSRAFGNT